MGVNTLIFINLFCFSMFRYLVFTQFIFIAMKNVLIILIMSLILCSGCKFFKKSSSKAIDTITADTVQLDTGLVEPSAYMDTPLEPVAAVTQKPAPRARAESNTYYMIVGCFTMQQNAEKYAAKIRGMGYEAQILSGRDNFQMVAARKYTSYKAGVNELDKFRNEVSPNAWVYLSK